MWLEVSLIPVTTYLKQKYQHLKGKWNHTLAKYKNDMVQKLPICTTWELLLAKVMLFLNINISISKLINKSLSIIQKHVYITLFSHFKMTWFYVPHFIFNAKKITDPKTIDLLPFHFCILHVVWHPWSIWEHQHSVPKPNDRRLQQTILFTHDTGTCKLDSYIQNMIPNGIRQHF